jgi:hypothetical protein
MCLGLITFNESFVFCFFQCLFQTHFVDESDPGGRNPEADPTVFFREEYLFIKQIDIKGPFGPAFGM